MFKVQKAYKYQLKTNGDIEGQLTRICGSSRFLWNKSLALNLDRLEKGQSLLWYNELAFWLTLWKSLTSMVFLRSALHRFCSRSSWILKEVSRTVLIKDSL